MASTRLRYGFAFSLLLLLPALPALCESPDALPDAPLPAQQAVSPLHASSDHPFSPSKWYGVVDPGETIPPLYAHDKMMFWLYEQASPVALIPGFLQAGLEQLRNGDPKYGSDSGAFGERLGAFQLRDASMRFFSDSLVPTLTHEDPRYYRMAYGGFTARTVYALKGILITQRDSGAKGFNCSQTIGNLAGSALTMAYYPHPSANATVVFETWGFSLVGTAGNKLVREFWPDVRDALFHHHGE